MRKSQVLQVIESLPDEVDFGVLLDKLLLLRKLEVAEQEIAEGKGIPQQEAQRIVASWFTSSGPPAPCGT